MHFVFNREHSDEAIYGMVKETLASAIAPKVCSSKPGWQFDPGTTQKPTSSIEVCATINQQGVGGMLGVEEAVG